MIKYYTKRVKPLSQITARDIPRGLDAYSVMTHDDLSYAYAFVNTKRKLDREVINLLEIAKIFYEIKSARSKLPIISYASKDYYGIEGVKEFIRRFQNL